MSLAFAIKKDLNQVSEGKLTGSDGWTGELAWNELVFVDPDMRSWA